MKQPLENILSDVASGALEKLAFLFAFPAEEAGSEWPDSGAAASVSFSGAFSGSLVMQISDDALFELTANMLGLADDEETTAEQQHDALKEALNVICGNLLPALAGSQAVFNIDSPRLVSGAQAEEQNHDGGPDCRVNLDLESGQCQILLFTENGMT